MSVQRILVIEESPVAATLTTILTEAGHNVTSAASAAKGVEALAATPDYDLVIAGLSMTKINGVHLLDRCNQEHPDLPVVLLAAASDVPAALAAIREGAYDFLTKPLERERLLVAASRALEYRRLKRENRAYQSNRGPLAAQDSDQLQQAMNSLQMSYDLTLEIAADLQCLKDAESVAHAKRVTAFTIALSRAMGLSSEVIRVVARGAMLHDIGMIAIPDAIIQKPGPLTATEMRILREHCFHGYQVLKKIPFLTEAAEVVYAHEERYDGPGFPRGLKGDAIPLGARIFCVAHALDAIITDRPYRQARSLSEARVEIAQLAGKQFDPAVVRVYLDMPDKIWMDLRAEIEKHAQMLPIT
jgi:response regulator RpfG family c-di-GMP phosphodiesterase